MSRSYRKTPIKKVVNTLYKKLANKKCRKEEIGNGSEFKKHYESCNIFDQKYRLDSKREMGK